MAKERVEKEAGSPIRRSTQCTARGKHSKLPCRNDAIRGGNVCRMHGGSAPQVKKKAAQRIMEAADDAAGLLVLFMEDSKNDIKVRTQIAQDLLNRAGFAGKQTISVETPRWEDVASSILVDLGESNADDLPVLEAASVKRNAKATSERAADEALERGEDQRLRRARTVNRRRS